MKSKTLTTRAGTIGELVTLLWHKKLWWMIPLLGLLAIVVLIVILAQSSSVAPWMYPLIALL